MNHQHLDVWSHFTRLTIPKVDSTLNRYTDEESDFSNYVVTPRSEDLNAVFVSTALLLLSVDEWIFHPIQDIFPVPSVGCAQESGTQWDGKVVEGKTIQCELAWIQAQAVPLSGSLTLDKVL